FVSYLCYCVVLLSYRYFVFLYIIFFFFFFIFCSSLSSSLFPYTTLFRSSATRERASPMPELSMVCAGRSSARSMTSSRIPGAGPDRKSTRLNSSHVSNSYAVFSLKKKKNTSKAIHHHKYKYKLC